MIVYSYIAVFPAVSVVVPHQLGRFLPAFGSLQVERRDRWDADVRRAGTALQLTALLFSDGHFSVFDSHSAIGDPADHPGIGLTFNLEHTRSECLC